MKSFAPPYLSKLSIPVGTSIIYGLCAEAKGKEGLWQRAKPEVLEALRAQSIISSTESSNRIEGVEVDRERLQPLVQGTITPRDRPEEEVVGYRNALHWIHKEALSIEINPESIQELHRLAQLGSVGDAGKWKSKNNEIIEIYFDGSTSVRFIPLEPELVPSAIQSLCNAYKDAAKNSKLPDLLLIATFVFDFLCIHPFRDGNGRVSRLLTLLLLYQYDYNVGRYVSIEKVIEDSKIEYYNSLQSSSAGWHTSEHNLEPIWNYFVRTVRIAYEQLQNRVEIEGDFYGGKTELIRKAVLRQLTPFSLNDIYSCEKGVSKALVKKVLYQMRAEGLIELEGTGRGAQWRRISS